MTTDQPESDRTPEVPTPTRDDSASPEQPAAQGGAASSEDVAPVEQAAAAPVEASPEPPDAALEHVVDDLAPKEAAGDWVLAEMRKGRPAEELVAEMQATGWSAEDAEWVVEYVRKLTRAERGVTTREEVARTSYKNYRESTKRLPLFMIFAALPNLIRSILGLRALTPKRQEPSDARGFEPMPAASDAASSAPSPPPPPPPPRSSAGDDASVPIALGDDGDDDVAPSHPDAPVADAGERPGRERT